MWGLWRTSGAKRWLWIVSAVLAAAAAAVTAETTPSHHTLSVSAPHLLYTCPSGATAKLECQQKGGKQNPSDNLKHTWLFTPHSDKHCEKIGPRNQKLSNHTLPAGVKMDHSNEKMWVTLQNVTIKDQGRYCCVLLDVRKESTHPEVVQRVHSHVVLHVSPWRNGSTVCTVWDPAPAGGSVPVALALSACIFALLSLPLILVLVYKQRQTAHSNRRGQELVRMDSEAQGHENPVFLGGSPQAKTRTVSQIMTRQPSETGHHLLSDPGTPLSPPAHGDVFFPSEDVIPEAADLVQV